MRSCCICCKRERAGNGSFFGIPKEQERFDEWNRICQNKLTPSSRICADHFLPGDIMKTGGRKLLLPIAIPFVHRFFQQSSVVQDQSSFPRSEEAPENTTFKNKKKLFKPNPLNVMPPQLQEQPIMQISPIKPLCCTSSTQTNTRLCGLVQASGYSDDFRFICFYCTNVFPLEKWKTFITHLKEDHNEVESLEMFKYVSNDHDYTPINLSSSTLVEEALENVIKDETASILEDPLEPTLNSFHSMVFNPTSDYVQDENNISTSSSNILIETENFTIAAPNAGILQELNYSRKEPKYSSLKKYITKNRSKQRSTKTALSRCLKRTNTIDTIEPEESEVYNAVSSDIVHQKPTEITFQYTPREIVDLLLDSMKNYPVLWQHDYEPFNEGFYDAVENVCKIINEKWSLNIDNLTMRRSINRMIRFYCSLFPNTNVENVDKFTSYYDKFAEFLPSSVHEIAYARCSHCYICFTRDFDLKRHLLKEYKYLQWPYKCTICEECFRDSDEYEFHKILPHYDENFRCEQCKKRFNCSYTYRRHVSRYHPKQPGAYTCDVCSKTFQTKQNLRMHKLIHGERKFKCHLCTSSFFGNSKLKLHLKSHRKELDFICEVCGKGFLGPHNLRQHMKMHTGAKVNCSICNMRLRRSSLKRHLRLTHVALEGTVEKLFRKGKERRNDFKKHLYSKSALRKEERGISKCYCNICDISFEKHKLIKDHNKKFHSDKWSCKICSSEYGGKRNLKQHYRRFHKLHFTKVFRLVEENENLNSVLDMKTENIDKLGKVVGTSKRTENVHSSTIQNKIIETDDDIFVSEEIKIEFMSDLFTELLKENQ